MDSVRMQVYFVLRILDGATGRPITGAKVCETVRRLRPAEKGNGYYVFSKPLPAASCILLQVSGFQAKTVRPVPEGRGPGAVICYMDPAPDYPLSSGMYGILGSAEPGTLWRVVQEEPAGRLLADCQAGASGLEILLLNQYPQWKCRFQIRQGNVMEFLSLYRQDRDMVPHQRTEKTGERMGAETPLLHSYKGGEALLYAWVPAQADDAGVCTAVIPSLKPGKAPGRFSIWSQTGEKLKQVEVRAGGFERI